MPHTIRVTESRSWVWRKS